MNYLRYALIFGLFSCTQGSQTVSIEKDPDPISTHSMEKSNLDMPREKPNQESPKQSTKSNLSQRVFFTENVGWGYQIFEGNTLLLKQEYIPAIQGNHAFESKKTAEVTAYFVLSKIEKGIFPPTLSVRELDSLGVLPSDYSRH